MILGQIGGIHPLRLLFYYMCFASKTLHYVDAERTRNQMLVFPGVLKGAVNYLYKKLFTLENGKRNLQTMMSIANTSQAFCLLVFASVCEVFEVGKGGEESKILLLSDIDALMLSLPHLFIIY